MWDEIKGHLIPWVLAVVTALTTWLTHRAWKLISWKEKIDSDFARVRDKVSVDHDRISDLLRWAEVAKQTDQRHEEVIRHVVDLQSTQTTQLVRMETSLEGIRDTLERYVSTQNGSLASVKNELSEIRSNCMAHLLSLEKKRKESS